MMRSSRTGIPLLPRSRGPEWNGGGSLAGSGMLTGLGGAQGALKARAGCAARWARAALVGPRHRGDHRCRAVLADRHRGGRDYAGPAVTLSFVLAAIGLRVHRTVLQRAGGHDPERRDPPMPTPMPRWASSPRGSSGGTCCSNTRSPGVRWSRCPGRPTCNRCCTASAWTCRIGSPPAPAEGGIANLPAAGDHRRMLSLLLIRGVGRIRTGEQPHRRGEGLRSC